MTNYIAKQFDSPEDLEIRGVVLDAFKHNLQEEMTEPIFNKHGLDSNNLSSDEWYSQSVMSDIYREIYRNGGGSSSLIAMGKASVDITLDLLKPDSIETFIENINEPILSQMRNLPDGYGWIVEKLGDQHYRITNNTDAPNDLMYGYLWEMLRQLITDDEHFEVLPIKNFEAGSKYGAIYEISWGED